MPADQDEELDGDFLHHFYQGGEMLRAGQLSQAREHLEVATDLRPENSKCQNLLGLVYYKLGLFGQSIEIYRDLITRFPEEETLRINLATVLIRAERLDEAEEELSLAVKLKPNHEKAHRTLAVVLMRTGQLEKARQHLNLAGVEDHEQFFKEIMTQEQGLAEDDGMDAELTSPPPAAAAVKPRAEQIAPKPAAVPVAAVEKPTEPAPDPEPKLTARAIFRIEGEELGAQVQGRLFARLEGLVWAEGELQYSPAKKRFGGEETQYDFGDAESVVTVTEGDGGLFFAAPLAPNGYHIHSQKEGSGFYVEDRIFAFAGSDSWENGRLQGNEDADLPIFHVSGAAQLVLLAAGKLALRPVDAGKKFLVDAQHLLGWWGELAPRLILAEPPLPHRLFLEFSGQGSVLYHM